MKSGTDARAAAPKGNGTVAQERQREFRSGVGAASAIMKKGTAEWRWQWSRSTSRSDAKKCVCVSTKADGRGLGQDKDVMPRAWVLGGFWVDWWLFSGNSSTRCADVFLFVGVSRNMRTPRN